MLGSAAHQVILKLLDSGRAWVKVSAAYLNTAESAKNYQDTIPIARSLIEAAPERMVSCLGMRCLSTLRAVAWHRAAIAGSTKSVSSGT